MFVMPWKPSASPRAVVTTAHWSHDERAAVLGSLRGQVSAVFAPDDVSTVDRGPLLVVTSPVVFAHGAVDRIMVRSLSPGRVVTRVLVPEVEATSVARWSGDWVARLGVIPTQLADAGLMFDRHWLPHDDPQVRAWIRADEVGAIGFGGDRAAALRWSRLEGVRLSFQHGIRTCRSLLG